MDQSSPLELTKTLYRAEQARDVAALIACIHPEDRDLWAPHIRRIARETEELDALRVVVRAILGDAEADMLDKKGFDSLYGTFSGADGGAPPDWSQWAFKTAGPGSVNVYIDGKLYLGGHSLLEDKWYVGPESDMIRYIMRVSRLDRQRDTDLCIKEMRRVKQAILDGTMSADEYRQWLTEPVPIAR